MGRAQRTTRPTSPRRDGTTPELLASLPPEATVAVVGRPNVGKSTLFNRLVGGHNAIVEDQPGVTRDRRYGVADWSGKVFRLVDTGGLDLGAARRRPDDTAGIMADSVTRQAMRAVEEAALVLFVLDAQEGLTPEDREAAGVLRRSGKPVVWVANKVDGLRQEGLVGELYALGAEEVIGVSAEHGRNVGELLDRILERLPNLPRFSPPEAESQAEAPIRVALVGRPNAGKSSLFNRFAGEERVIVDATPGTTRDPVDTLVEYEGRRLLLIDTAGIRRRVRVEAPMEKIAVAMAEKSIGRAEVVVLMIDGAGGVGEQDARIAGMCEEAGRALVVGLNKRDLLDGEAERALREEFQRKLQFVPWARVVSLSARTGKGVGKLVEAIAAARASYRHRVPTGELNRFFEGLVERHPPSLYRGHPVKLYYITQAQIAPPTFVLSVNHPEGVHFSYRRYIANQIRAEFGFEGTPVRLICRARSGKKR